MTSLSRGIYATTAVVISSMKHIRIVAAFSTQLSQLPPIQQLKNPNLIYKEGFDTSTTTETKRFNVFDPAATLHDIQDGTSIIATIDSMGQDDARACIEKSAEVLPMWRDQTTGLKRSQILSKWSELIRDNMDDIATIMTLESGKPLSESVGEINYGLSFLDFYASEAVRPTSAGGGIISPSTFTSPDGSPRGKIMAIQEAIGVCAMITPWNFPFAMITRKVAPSLAVGCTVVLKPSELTPLSAIALQTLAYEAGVPEGVFQLVTACKESTPEVGAEFCSNPIVKKISFTGSSRVGKLLMKQSSDTVKRLSLELGGNAAFIVFEDADIDVAVSAAISSKFRNAGQTCVCADRFIIHKSIEDEFITKLHKKVSEFCIGRGLEEGTTIGPLISSEAVQNIKEKVDEAIRLGADVLIGGSPMENGPNFFEPTIIRGVDPKCQLWSAETFGPVAALLTFDTEEEALELANDTTSGLASYFCSQNMDRVFRVAARLENGIIGINDGIISTFAAPFGGVKESGLGREGSSDGIAEFLEKKYIFINTS